MAVETAKVLNHKEYMITGNTLREGLIKAKWPGRLEIINKSPLFLIDGAHNVEGTQILADNLKRYYPEHKITVIIGVLADKDYQSMIKVVISMAKQFITVTPKSSRALKVRNLATVLKTYCENVLVGQTTEAAVKTSLDLCTDNEIICAFGSLYYIGEVRVYFGLK